MVSIWPWKSDENSPASFEKTLSNLSGKITKAATNLDSLRQRSRRLSVFWILYSSFAYLLYSTILISVVGWKNWGLVEISALVGGPILIYLVRLGLITYYNYRTSRSQARLDGLQDQRDKTIDQLKSATKYNTTQELLKKYGGVPGPKTKPSGASERQSTSHQMTPGNLNERRTGISPPPTANISGKKGQASFSDTLQQPPKSENSRGQPRSSFPATTAAPWQRSSSPIQENAEFAPNAFPSTQQYIQPSEGPKWYDRLMDVLLGEDESLPRNRIALICNQCRLVNGQAPPGVKGLENLGRWRCGGCGTMNGEEVEVNEIVASINEEKKSSKRGNLDEVQLAINKGNENQNTAEASENEQSDVTQYSEASSNEDGAHFAHAEKSHPPPSEESPLPKRRLGRPRAKKDQGS